MATLQKSKLTESTYVLEQHRSLPEAEQPKFTLIGVTGGSYDEMMNLMTSDKRGSAMRKAAERGILGWEGIDNLPFVGRLYAQDKDKKKRPTSEELDELGDQAIYELGMEVVRLSSLSEAEKN